MQSFTKLLEKWRGKRVGIEGTAPLMVPGADGKPQVVYSPAVGTIVDIFDDGVVILEEGADENHPTVYLFQNMRSVSPIFEGKVIVPRSKLIT